MGAGVGPDPLCWCIWMPRGTRGGVDIALPRRAEQVPSSPLLFRSLSIWTVGLVLRKRILARVTGAQVWGKWAYSGRAVHSRDQASWTFTSFLVAFVLADSEADVIACSTELWRLGNPQFLETTGPSRLSPQI